MWVLGTEVGSSARAMGALYHCVKPYCNSGHRASQGETTEEIEGTENDGNFAKDTRVLGTLENKVPVLSRWPSVN